MFNESRTEQSRALFEVSGNQLHYLGKPIYGASQAELLVEVDRLSALGRPALLITLNVDQSLNLESDISFRKAYDSADLVVIDGTPISWLGKVLGVKQVSRNTGADLLPAVAARSATFGWSLAITGGNPQMPRQAAENLAGSTGASVAAIDFPFISDIADEASNNVIKELADAEPDVVFLCLGSPKQEIWFEEWKHQLPAAVYIGAGAAVDFTAGAVSRAPRIIQRMGLEWLYRLAREPRRLAHRYLIKGPRFILLAARSIAAAVRKSRA